MWDKCGKARDNFMKLSDITSAPFAAVNLLIAVAFGVASPSAQWVQMRIAQRHLRQAQNVAQDYHGLKVGK
jgi:hypothetical protein